VVRLDLEALARIGSHDNQFEAVLGHLVRIFASDAKLLETRGSLIVRQLCVLLNGERIYQMLARLLQTHDVRVGLHWLCAVWTTCMAHVKAVVMGWMDCWWWCLDNLA
jgi:hypothetical protein